MNTSILTIVLATAVLSGQSGTPAWQSDYSQAQQQGSAQKKPLVVVFGSGANGWAKVVREASPSADLTKLLAEKYVCVYVDTATPAGAKLAQGFGMNGNVGIVISDRVGTSQAFWHQGDLPGQSMMQYLQKYSNQDVVVQRTETVSTRSSFYPSNETPVTWDNIGTGSSYCPSCNGGGRSRR